MKATKLTTITTCSPQIPADSKLRTKAFDLPSLMVIRALLHHDPSLVNTTDKEGLTPLALAVGAEDPALVRYVL